MLKSEMRLLILLVVMFSFSVSGFIDVANAAAETHNCAHHQVDSPDNDSDEPCHSDQQQDCEDCCCAHIHSMAIPLAYEKLSYSYEKKKPFLIASGYSSAEPESLYRPPRI